MKPIFRSLPYSKIAANWFLPISVGILLICCALLIGCAPARKPLPASPELSLATYRSLQQLENRCPRIQQPDVETALDRVLKRIDRERKFSNIFVMNCKVPFSLIAPDGAIFLSRGMLEIIPSEASLAFLLAHELGHYSLGHLQLDPHESLHYRLEDEEAADRYALKQVIAAHYNPWAALQIFSSPALLEHTAQFEGARNKTHPYPLERRAEMERLLAYAKWTPPGTVSSRSFLRMKQVFS